MRIDMRGLDRRGFLTLIASWPARAAAGCVSQFKCLETHGFRDTEVMRHNHISLRRGLAMRAASMKIFR